MITVDRRKPPTAGSYPSYVQDYLDRVTAVDVQNGNTSGLELGVTDAASLFIEDLVAFGYLGVSGGVISQAASLIKMLPVLGAARTRQGAQIPVVGPTLTEFGTAGGWNYNRKTGLAGNVTNNYLSTNFSNAALPQNNRLAGVMANPLSNNAGHMLAARTSGTDIGSMLIRQDIVATCSGNANAEDNAGAAMPTNTFTFKAVSRSSAASYISRVNGTNYSITRTSGTPANQTILLFQRNDLNAVTYSNARIFGAVLGETIGIDLAVLNARLITLMNAYAAAIP